MGHIEWLPVATAAISGGGIGWITTFIQDKSKSRAYTMGAVDQAVKTALESVTAEVNRLNHELDELREAHKQCQVDLSSMRKEIDKLMSGPIPGYFEIGKGATE